jgi:hypothetical protein
VTAPRPSRDRELNELLKEADREFAPSPARLATLSGRIDAAAAPMLREREARNRTVWDYAERWSSTLIPLGALTAVAAAMCLFRLSAQREPVAAPTPAPRFSASAPRWPPRRDDESDVVREACRSPRVGGHVVVAGTDER